MIIYRAVSQAEKDDYYASGGFHTGNNTLEAKQFFKSETGALEFVKNSLLRHFVPPYQYIFHIEINKECLEAIDYAEQEIDRYSAITIYEADLPAFNNCVTLAEEHGI